MSITASAAGLEVRNAEAILIDRAVAGDRNAFSALYDTHVTRVYHHTYYLTSNTVLAEDITQEVFIKAWKSINKYTRTGAPFIAWLNTIARHLVIDHYRSKKREIPVEEAPVIIDNDSNPGILAEASFEREHIRKAVLKLKGVKQKVILMRFISGMSYREIGEALHKKEGAVRVIQFRALKDLKAILERDRGRK